ncbi:Na(+)/H(+) exchange regulatory cofactor NHE-RF2 [Chanos chanos]|uniref:Na(+)/H(+) exchange regulatory cofactor NHE-RF2 n=1 Tax=Chanos chanos TaxID=29144 RepID=A0A6J2VUP2_CHACN|nr:Na(+)/H(+) exchange regulatory cofactor NHE-RF2 [Chanos chanos]
MASSLEREILEREMRPRLCYLSKGERGYGFHLHGERSRGAQFIRKIEPGSPADLSGLRSGDRVVEVNGENVEGEPHHLVVQRILAVENRTRLLVVDRDTDEFLRFHGLPCTEDRAVEMGSLSPRTSVTSSPRTSTPSSPRTSVPPSPRESVTPPYTRENADKRKPVEMTTRTDAPVILVNGNQSPVRGLAVMNGSPVYRPHNTRPFMMTSAPSSDPGTDPSLDLSLSDTSAHETLDGKNIIEFERQDHRPRLCHIVMGSQGYGFNLHSDKKRVGHYVRVVDPDSPAEHAGLRPKDRLIEVNDVNIDGLKHSEVVALIRGGAGETSLLVVDPETDELFKRLGIIPTRTHLKEDCVDGPMIESPVMDSPITDSSTSPSPIPDSSVTSAPIINIALTDKAMTNGSPRHRNHGSSSSHSTMSELSTELSSSDTSHKMADFDDHDRDRDRGQDRDGHRESAQPSLDPFWESGLRLSPTAAEAKEKVRSKRSKKRAPPMDWNKKQEIFSNF